MKFYFRFLVRVHLNYLVPKMPNFKTPTITMCFLSHATMLNTNNSLDTPEVKLPTENLLKNLFDISIVKCANNEICVKSLPYHHTTHFGGRPLG